MAELRQREEKMQEMAEKEREENRRRQEERESQYTATLKGMQDTIAKANRQKKSRGGFFSRLVGAVEDLLGLSF